MVGSPVRTTSAAGADRAVGQPRRVRGGGRCRRRRAAGRSSAAAQPVPAPVAARRAVRRPATLGGAPGSSAGLRAARDPHRPVPVRRRRLPGQPRAVLPRHHGDGIVTVYRDFPTTCRWGSALRALYVSGVPASTCRPRRSSSNHDLRSQRTPIEASVRDAGARARLTSNDAISPQPRLLGLIPPRCWSPPASRACSFSARMRCRTYRSPTARSSSGCAWPRTSSSGSRCRTPTRTCSPWWRVLASFGIVMVYRIDSTLARQQAQWFVLGLVLFAVTILAFRDYRKLERYRYVIVLISLGLLLLPRLPGIGYGPTGRISACASPGCSCSSRPSSRRSAWSCSWPATCATRARCSSSGRAALLGIRCRRSSTSARW